MLIAESGRVHLHGVVTRDVVHVNSGVREGSPPRRSYEGCGSLREGSPVVTRDVVHVNSGVREGSPPRRSYEGCGSC